MHATARHVNCYIFPMNLLNQYFTGSRFLHHNRFLYTAFVVVVQGALQYVVAVMDELV
jgi:hypothetical protein